MHWPGVEPGSTAWKAAMLTVTPPMPPCEKSEINRDFVPSMLSWQTC